jgi:hypothetical protein
MRCEEARRALSAALDGGADPAAGDRATAHLDGCSSCAVFERGARRLRQELRFELVDDAVDVVPGVLATLEREAPTPLTAPATRTGVARGRAGRGRRLLPVAACFVVGVLVGALVVAGDGTRRQPPAAAAPLGEQVHAAQREVRSLTARLEVVEHGWHPDVPVRTYSGSLAYEAPEALALVLDDTTSYPDETWRPNEVRMVARDGLWWAQGLRRCPTAGQPSCTPPTPRTEVVEHREPFASATPVPLDLVVPVRSFEGEAEADLGRAEVDGRDALGVRTTAAQVAPLLDGLRLAGNLREVHPADEVVLWLDAEALVPLWVVVRAGDVPGRDQWGRNRGYADAAGSVLLDVRVHDVVLDEPVPTAAFADAPAGAPARDAGFADRAPARPAVPDLPPGLDPVLDVPRAPAGLALHRQGSIATGATDAVEVWSWSDGRAWLTLRATTGWSGGRLFGELAAGVREVPLPGGGVAYVDEAGDRVALHGSGVDAVLAGTVGTDELLRVAADLRIDAQPVPPGWDEADLATVDAAAAALDGLLLPDRPAGFAAPGVTVRHDGGAPVVTVVWAGPGARSLQLVATTGARLDPPLDQDVVGVVVRGLDGRASAERGELEWVEDGVVHRLSSATLSLPELLAVAETMDPVP